VEEKTPVIPRLEALALLRDACPSFASLHPVFDDADELGFGAMSEVSALARHLVDLAEVGDAGEFPAVFDVVERLLAGGDDETVRLLRTCLIEDMQNITSHRDAAVATSELRELLGEDAREVWDELDESWAAATRHSISAEPRPPAAEFLDLGLTDRRNLQSEARELADGTLARPSDVLRYEASRFDDAVDRRAEHRRRRPLIMLMVVLMVLCVLIIAVS
jgi:hypothetical protein